jgi:predicted SnoaL-like aldol condensation-catalyzing enzyme
MPERTSYDEAMQLSQARLRVQDPDVKQGKVEMITMRTNVGSMQKPWGRQGGFAVVYKFRTQSGKLRALRCFLVQMTPDTQFRYERIGRYFAAYASKITVEFKYYGTGILLKENVYGRLESNTYPVVEMEWVEGMTLVNYIDELCAKRDQVGLDDALNQWQMIIATLRAANISHGDLAGVNILVKPDGRLVLVDYDGVYIPEFAGLPQIVLGQADFQHPQMNQRPFNEHTDDFSAMVIYTALAALKIQPDLWGKYTRRNGQGELIDENILFKQQDFVDPDRSSLFMDIERISDPQVTEAVQKLRQACKQPIGQVVIDISPPEKQALTKLEQAIQRGDDEEILNAWVPGLLDNYGPAQQYLSRVTQARQAIALAQQRRLALIKFRVALMNKSVQQIADSYDAALLDSDGSITNQERGILQLAQDFVRAYRGNDDQAIVAASEEILNFSYRTHFAFSAQEKQRIELAQQRKIALVKFRMSLMSKNPQQISNSYDWILDDCKNVTVQERETVKMAKALLLAFFKNDDNAIIDAWEAIRNAPDQQAFILSQDHQQRIQSIQQRSSTLTKFRLALAGREIQQIADSCDSSLESNKAITSEERAIVALARAFTSARKSNDDQGIVAVYDEIQQSRYSQSFSFTEQDQRRISLAQQCKAALIRLRLAMMNKHVCQIAAAYDSVLDGCGSITKEERAQVQLVRSFAQAYQKDDDREIADAAFAIQQSSYQRSLLFTSQESQRIALAQSRNVKLGGPTNA